MLARCGGDEPPIASSDTAAAVRDVCPGRGTAKVAAPGGRGLLERPGMVVALVGGVAVAGAVDGEEDNSGTGLTAGLAGAACSGAGLAVCGVVGELALAIGSK